MKKTIYILTLLCVLAATFAMFMGCESAVSHVSAQPTLYVWCMPGCEPCREQKPMVDAIEATGSVEVVHRDLISQPELARTMGVKDAPTYIVFVGGHEVWRGNSIAPLYRQLTGAR